MKIPSSHPRARSLRHREKIVQGVEQGITSTAGLIAHGRGETFDYLLGEKTHSFARKALQTATAALLTARHPVISINGNVAALLGKELALFSNRWNIPLEVNIFHHTKTREKRLVSYLKKCGAKKVLGSGSGRSKIIPSLAHARRKMHLDGIAKADVVFVPLEDGDRCQALMKMGKKVITIDLNPLSRTARYATITIVDELTRVFLNLEKSMETLHRKSPRFLKAILQSYNNRNILRLAEQTLRRRI